MSKRANPTLIGAFVVGALALAVIGIITLGGMQLFKKELPFVMFFSGSIGGLDVGAPVEIRGVKIGAVRKIRLFVDNRIGVYIAVDPSLLPREGTVRTEGNEAVEGLIQRGLRAQLKTQSLLTGLLLVYLDFFPGTPITLVGLDPDVKEIPTVPTTLEQFQARIEAVLNKLGTIDLDELIKDVSQTLKGAKDLMSSPELKDTIISADAALKSANVAIQDAQVVLKHLDTKVETLGANADTAVTDVRALLGDARKALAKIDGEIGPLAASIKDASTSAQGTLRGVDRAVAGDSRMGAEVLRALRDVADAARSLKALADYLESHPEALLRGKGSPESK
jgi:phospholipid/cholesterol/gamma-HCH transport system substrate-binding protein